MPGAKSAANGYVLIPVILMLTMVAVVSLLLTEIGGQKIARSQNFFDADKQRYTLQAAEAQAAIQANSQKGCDKYSNLSNQTFSGVDYDISYSPSPGSVTYEQRAATDTAYIFLDGPDSNYGSSTEMYVKMADSSTRHALLKFDLPSLAGGEIIYEANLWVHLVSTSSPTAMHLHRVTDSWSEATVTWNNTNADYDAQVYSTVPGQTAHGQWLRFNITDLVGQWIAGTHTNHGVLLRGMSGTSFEALASRHYPTASLQPFLELSYGPDNGGQLGYTASVKKNGQEIRQASGTVDKMQPLLYQVPSVLTNATDDATIKKTKQNHDYGAASTLEISNNGGDDNRALIKFDTGSLLALDSDADLQKVELSLYLTGGTFHSQADLDLHRLTQTWIEGTGVAENNDTGATYKEWDAENKEKWDTKGGDFDATVLDTQTITGLDRGWYHWDITDTYKDWLSNPSDNHGVILLTSSGDVEDLMFASTDHAIPDRYPRVIFHVGCPCGSVCFN